jgi:4-alpha-glucanotransferase
MPPFAAYWRGLDIAQRERQGLLDRAGARRERKARAELRASVRSFLAEQHAKTRKNGMRAILEACLVFLSKSPARVALVSLEDLWLETKPQNVPGTASEMPNWQKKMRYPYEHFSRMRSVLTCLERVDALRTKGEPTDG